MGDEKDAFKVTCPAKVILCGEYAVVSGLRGVGCAIDMRVEGKIRRTRRPCSYVKFLFQDNLGEARRVDETEPGFAFLRKMVDALGRPVPKFKLRIYSQIPPASGLGFSGACSVVAAALLLVLLKEDEKDPGFMSKVNALAYEGEKGTCGTPSGIDNTLCCYGGCLSYEQKAIRKRLQLRADLSILVVFTGPKSTCQTLQHTRSFAAMRPKEHDTIIEGLSALSKTAERILFKERRPVEEVSGCFSQAQTLLEQLGVISPSVRSVVERLRSIGLSAKLTGGGGDAGGSAIALLGDPAHQLKLVRDALRDLDVHWWVCKPDAGLVIG